MFADILIGIKKRRQLATKRLDVGVKK